MLEEMQRSSRGFRCSACWRSGKLNARHPDGVPMGPGDYCPGCGEPICGRHTPLLDPELHHALGAHMLSHSE